MIVIIMGLLLPLLMAAATQHSRIPGVKISIILIFIVRPCHGTTILILTMTIVMIKYHHHFITIFTTT